MSTRWFCDACGEEIGRDVVGERYRPVLEILHPTHGFVQTKILVEVMVGVGPVKGGEPIAMNDGNLCLACLKRAIVEGRES